MRALLDVNVLVAWLDGEHADHARAARWLATERDRGWATCALTQNGVVRILSQPRYLNPISPAQAIDLLARATASERHEFWAPRIQVCDAAAIDSTRVHGPAQVADIYLLALATAQGGRLVTMDRSIPLDAVRDATSANLVTL